jgi:hypothetical protein
LGWTNGESVRKTLVKGEPARPFKIAYEEPPTLQVSWRRHKERAERQDDTDRVSERIGADLGPHYFFLKYSVVGNNKEISPALKPLSSGKQNYKKYLMPVDFLGFQGKIEVSKSVSTGQKDGFTIHSM